MGLRAGEGETMDGREETEMGFFGCIVHACTHEFAAKKKQGKDCEMQRHEQVLPPCRCIAQINAEESYKLDKIGRGVPSRFWASFLKAREARSKKKGGRQQDRNSGFG